MCFHERWWIARLSLRGLSGAQQIWEEQGSGSHLSKSEDRVLCRADRPAAKLQNPNNIPHCRINSHRMMRGSPYDLKLSRASIIARMVGCRRVATVYQDRLEYPPPPPPMCVVSTVDSP
jgi:hypothetical protein